MVVEALLGVSGLALIVWAVRADASWQERHLTAARCIRDSHTLGVGNFERGLAVVVAALLLFVARPLVWRRVARRGITVRGVMANSLAAVLGLVAAELCWRRLSPTRVPDIPMDPCLRGAPIGAYIPRAALSDTTVYKLFPSWKTTWPAGAGVVEYCVNAEGNRALSVETKPDHARPTLFVAGESIALGVGVSYEETFGALIEAETGVQVVNVAVGAYGLDQAYVHASEAMTLYEHPIALVMVFIPEMADRSEAEDRPRLRASGGQLIRQPATPEWLRDIRIRSTFRDLYHGDAEVDDLRALVRATVDLAHRRGAYPLFVTTNFVAPCQDVAGHRPWLFQTLFDDQEVPRVHIDLPESQRVGGGEIHPGPRSHRQIADAVIAALRRASVL